MKHLQNLIADILLELIEGLYRLASLFRKKPQPSLLVSNIHWCTNSEWMDRLVAYKQLELWTDR